MAVIDWVIIKGRCIVVPKVIQEQALQLLLVNDMGIEKHETLSIQLQLLDRYEYQYKKQHKNYSTCLDFQQTETVRNIGSRYVYSE